MKSLSNYIVEFADNRSGVLHNIQSKIPQIYINWCLIRYCTRYSDIDILTLNHWKNELRTLLAINSEKIIKSGDVMKLLIQVWADFEVVERKCINEFNKKLKKELHINIDSGIKSDLHNDFCNEIAKFPSIMSKSREEINEYINTI